MNRTYVATHCALLFGMGYLGAMIWALDQADGITFYRQLHPLWSVLTVFVCFASLQPLVAAEFTHWLMREASGKRRWVMRQVAIGFVVFGLFLLVGVLQAPSWLVAVTLIPFTLAFVYPGFAFPPEVKAQGIDWDSPSHLPTRLHWVGLFVISVFLMEVWLTSQFYSTNAREAGGLKVPGIVIAIAVGYGFKILQNRKARHVPFLPMLKLQDTRWTVAWFQVFFICVAVMSHLIVFHSFAPYLFTKTMGEDLRQQGQIQSRRWEPHRDACKGKVGLLANTGQLFEICFDNENDLPRFTEGATVNMVVRTSYAGFYITEMAVSGGS